MLKHRKLTLLVVLAACHRTPLPDDGDEISSNSNPDLGSDMGAPETCSHADPSLDACPEGEKCMPYGDALDEDGCFPLEAEPVPLGEPCVDEDLEDGADPCVEHAMCVGSLLGAGQVCSPFCMLEPDGLRCDGAATCSLTNGMGARVCIQNCDPLGDTCVQDACVAELDFGSPHYFACREPGAVQYGGPCTDHSDCVEGSVCVEASLVPGCVGTTCCTNLCMVGDGACPDADMGQSCISAIPADGPEGLQHVGFCGFG
jgi:hypothetical protein